MYNWITLLYTWNSVNQLYFNKEITHILKKKRENLLDCKETNPVNPKGNQSWISLDGQMLKVKFQFFGHLTQRADSFEKDPDSGKVWRQEEKGTTENEMVRWHHWLNGHEFKQALRDSEGQASLAFCSPWGQRVRQDWETEQQPQLESLLITMKWGN